MKWARQIGSFYILCWAIEDLVIPLWQYIHRQFFMLNSVNAIYASLWYTTYQSTTLYILLYFDMKNFKNYWSVHLYITYPCKMKIVR